MSKTAIAKFGIGQVIRHRTYEFRGVVFDVDPEFSNTEEWLDAIPEPKKKPTKSRSALALSPLMPLTRDRIIGHDIERLAFRFTMLNAADTVECQISDAAMDELAGTKGTESMARQAQFLALRDAVEGIASDMFDKVPVVGAAAAKKLHGLTHPEG